MKSFLFWILVGTAAVCFGMPHTLELGPRLESAVVLPAPSDWVDGDETLHWDGEPDRGFNINGTYSYGCAQRYTEPDPLTVKAILYYLTGNADAVFVYVAGHGTMPSGSLAHDEAGDCSCLIVRECVGSCVGQQLPPIAPEQAHHAVDESARVGLYPIDDAIRQGL